jgi:hypothetical protein
VLVGTNDGRVTAVDLERGERLWEITVGGVRQQRPRRGRRPGDRRQRGRRARRHRAAAVRIVLLTPGTGDFHCGSCIRDNTLALGLRDLGHDATLVPLYLPFVVDEEDASHGAPILLGGINMYLQQVSGLFRRTPAGSTGSSTPARCWGSPRSGRP